MSGRLTVSLKRLTEDEIRKWRRISDGSSSFLQPEKPATNIIFVPFQNTLKRPVFSFPCPRCNVKFINITYLETHFQNVHRQSILLCPVETCKAYVDSSQDLERHFEIAHHDNQTLTIDSRLKKTVSLNMRCPHCPKCFMDRHTYLKHVETDHKQMFYCTHCGRKDAPFTGHIINRKKCFICNKQVFFCLTSAAQHEERCRLNDSKGWKRKDLFCRDMKCRMCSEVVVDDRRRHLLEKHSKDLFPCLEPKCPLFFMKPEFLDQHRCPWKKKENENTQDQVKRSKLDGRMPCSFFRNKSLARRMCSEVVISIQDRRRHLLEKHAKDVFPCPHPNCLRFFLNHEHMVQHHQEQHPTKVIKVKQGKKTAYCYLEGRRCYLCGKGGTLAGKQNKSEINLHVMAEHPDQFVKCSEDDCKLYFDNTADMLAHVQKEHLEEMAVKEEEVVFD